MLFSKIIEKKFDAVLGRYDGDSAIRYPQVSDFPELKSEAMDIPGDKGILLRGAFYFYGSLCPEKLVVFDHGIGAGHLAYLNEINSLAKRGYTVYSYDHTGCVSTGGSGILGFAQGVNDLDHVLTALQKDERFAAIPRKVVGHSWGGYACMNAAALHPEITHVVSLAGFLSAKSLVSQYIPRAFLRYVPEVLDRERMHNPAYTDLDARDSLKQSHAKLLFLQSRDDRMVKYELSGEPLAQALQGRADTEFVILDHRDHDPHRTEAAVQADGQMRSELERLHKKKQLSTDRQQKAFQAAYDWQAMSQQDPAVWKKIQEFLES